MFCHICGSSAEDTMGTSLSGCHHFICMLCLKQAVLATSKPGIRCKALTDSSTCRGKIRHTELESMVSERTFFTYLVNISKRPTGSQTIGTSEDPEAFLTTLTNDDKSFGWSHKLAAINNLRLTGRSQSEALESIDGLPVLETQFPIECAICFENDIPAGDGVVLKECFHMFCKACLISMVEVNNEAFIKCPYIDGNYSCVSTLQEREIKAIVSDNVFEKYLQMLLKLAEGSTVNSFHCKTPDCAGWCEFDEGAERFMCSICQKSNCLKCKAIHDGSCEDFKNKIVQNENDKLSDAAIQNLVQSGEFMRCPKCQIPVQKLIGCDWLQCSFCKTEICWVTRGPRWGPAGHGDISGGCKCRAINGTLCHPKCGNCH